MADFGVTEGLAVAGLAATAISTVASGISQSKAASYNAAVARNNAVTAEQNAAYARQSGQVQEELAGRKAAAQEGALRAGIAANNVDVNSGSALTVQEGQRETGLESEENVENNALLQSYGYQTQATGFTAQSGLLQSQASTAVPGSLLAAGGSFASNSALLPSKFQGMSSNGSGGVGVGNDN